MADDKTGKPNRINKTTYKTKYPYNQTTVFESGHELHWDNTPGHERIRIAHKDGSYWELSPGGKSVSYVVGHEQSYNKGGVTMTVDENNDVKVSGHQRTNISGGSHSEVAGENSYVSGGDLNMVQAGAMRLAVAGFAYIGINDNCNINVNGNLNMKVSGTATIESGDTMTLKAPTIQMNP